MRRTTTAGLVLAMLAVASCSSSSSSDDGERAEPTEWPAPTDTEAAVQDAGLELDRREQLANHRHTHLDVFVDGVPVEVPAGLGIVVTDPGVTRFEDPLAFGGIEECDEPCIAPLHTHDATGIVHTESADATMLTLGQLFAVWGVELDDDADVYVDGDLHRGDAADIPLADRVEIAVVIGSPPAEIPSVGDFTGA